MSSIQVKKTATELRDYVIKNQIDIVYKQILDAAIQGKFKIVLSIDFVLSNSCKAFFSKLGYNLNEMHTVEKKEYLKNFYEISWE